MEDSPWTEKKREMFNNAFSCSNAKKSSIRSGYTSCNSYAVRLTSSSQSRPISHHKSKSICYHMCFKRVYLAHSVEGKTRQRIDERCSGLESKLDFSELESPTPLRQMKVPEMYDPSVSVKVVLTQGRGKENLHYYNVKKSPVCQIATDISHVGIVRTMPLIGGFFRGLPFPPPLHSGASPHSPRFTLIGSQDLDGAKYQIIQYGGRILGASWPMVPTRAIGGRSSAAPRVGYAVCFLRPEGHLALEPETRTRGGEVVRLLASHQGELGSIPGGVVPGFSHMRIVLDDAAGRRFFSGISRFPSPCIPELLYTHLISPSSALKTVCSNELSTDVRSLVGNRSAGRRTNRSQAFTLRTREIPVDRRRLPRKEGLTNFVNTYVHAGPRSHRGQRKAIYPQRPGFFACGDAAEFTVLSVGFPQGDPISPTTAFHLRSILLELKRRGSDSHSWVLNDETNTFRVIGQEE
ncbi:hypothetical protein PR048_028831 [Dryococelus australis]|uniref:Uncharacterized protein n=1 Tax=Dryococelus australis TaxID=614101 RepID=A0ABQ9GC99_9NEOP|nr:hypothetical protein PR048_028831 [Dryococelus australis]